MQTTVELNDAVIPATLPVPICVTPPRAPTRKPVCPGKRLFHDIFSGEVIFHTPTNPAKKCKQEESLDLKTALETSGVKRKQRVRFAEDGVRITRVARMEKTLWYSREDLAIMKSTAKRECLHLNLDSTLAPAYGLPSKNTVDENQLPSLATSLRSLEFDNQRGLERWSSQSLMLSRCVTIVRARTEVHLEQINQTILGQNDPERIAAVYKTATLQARSFALVLGIVDASVLESEQ
mmetsp:Transcript_5325/g.10877  ORF Transcript_5325/g.10877 Transcript_5325/m.10877 type:complete len:236 (-) Transcript_5325:84-791(-)|eukprot:scaffold2510_cov169-Amphora_coffeaeformis.AAC.3